MEDLASKVSDDVAAMSEQTDADVPAKPKLKNTAKSSRKESAKPAKATLPKKASPAKPPAVPWTFPKNTLEDSIKIARAVEEKNAGNPMKPDVLAKAVGFNSISDWRFLDLLRSANQYGLVTGTGKISSVALTEIGQDVVLRARRLIDLKL